MCIWVLRDNRLCIVIAIAIELDKTLKNVYK